MAWVDKKTFRGSKGDWAPFDGHITGDGSRAPKAPKQIPGNAVRQFEVETVAPIADLFSLFEASKKDLAN